MTYTQIIERLRRHQEYIELCQDDCLGWSILCTCLRGSQNYGLDHKYSDVDSLTIVVPTVRSLVLGKTFSKEYTLDKEKLTVVDIQSYVAQLKKANPALLETAFTDYFVTPDNKYNSYKDELKEIAKRLLYCRPKATVYSVIGNIFSFLKKVYRDDDYNAKAMCGAYRLYEWLKSYLKDELNYDAPFEMKDLWFLREYWNMGNVDRGEDKEFIRQRTLLIKNLLATNNRKELEKQLDSKIINLEYKTEEPFDKLASWHLKVFQDINKV